MAVADSASAIASRDSTVTPGFGAALSTLVLEKSGSPKVLTEKTATGIVVSEGEPFGFLTLAHIEARLANRRKASGVTLAYDTVIESFVGSTLSASRLREPTS